MKRILHLSMASLTAALLCAIPSTIAAPFDPSGNRLVHLDEPWEVFHPSHTFPRLTTPQWVGEGGIEFVLAMGIDDMRNPANYEAYLRPIIDQLKEWGGRAPISIMANWVNPDDPQIQSWLSEGVLVETHTADHPCPILDKSNFNAAKSTYDRCIDHLWNIPNHQPIAFRTPCMDSINSHGPRLVSEILLGTTPAGHFLNMSTSVGMMYTDADPSLPPDIAFAPGGTPRFSRYRRPGYIGYIENYPYPYLVGNRLWEVPFTMPDDYEGSALAGDQSPQTIHDMKLAIDRTAQLQGVWMLCFHPYAWIANTQVIDVLRHAHETYPGKVRVLNLRDIHDRLQSNLLGGQPIRRPNGTDNGVRLLDINNDGYLDVIVANPESRQTRVWDPAKRVWNITPFPVALVDEQGQSRGGHFGILRTDGFPSFLIANEQQRKVWHFNGTDWIADTNAMNGLELDGEPLLARRDGVDLGLRFRDLTGDGTTECLISNPNQSAIFQWSHADSTWKLIPYSLPAGVSIVTEQGADNGVRFVDFNADGSADLIFSNPTAFGLWLFVPKPFLGFKTGFSREIIRGLRGQSPEIPMIVRAGPNSNNGAWFKFDHMWVQNEDTAQLPNHVDRLSYAELLNGLQPPPKPPEASLKSIKVADTCVVELVAHEPQIQDPVYFDWDADGSLWVVEMRDYPMGVDGGGVIKRLRDTNNDGFFNSAETFLTNLNFPSGVMPWKKGLLISAAPNLLYAEDTNGDGRADKIETLFSGFTEGNQQHRFNGFQLGLDNWIHGANGDSGGRILSHRTGKEFQLNGRDFRFNPDTGDFDLTSGQTQFTRRRDDWGNWFGGANYSWGWHYKLPEHYLRRNPRLPVRSTHQSYAQYPNAGRVYSISRLQQRFNDVGMAGHVTSANSFTPYRDNLFTGDFESSIFISDPTHNLVHREILRPDGITFTSHPSESESQSEFVASTDPWFRPTLVQTGPDGAIYIADMYRLVIEHPEWIPADTLAQINVRSGTDMGRIYRVRPRNAPLRSFRSLDTATPEELVDALQSPNGWIRDTAHRLLLEQRPSGIEASLENQARTAPQAKTRLHALCILNGLNKIDAPLLVHAMADPHPMLRSHAIRISESILSSAPPDSLNTNLSTALALCVEDPDIRVRFQLAFSLGEWADPIAASLLARIALKDMAHPDLMIAVLSSAKSHAPEILTAVLEQVSDDQPASVLISQLLVNALDETSSDSLQPIFDRLVPQDPLAPLSLWKLNAAASLVQAAERQNNLSNTQLFNPAWSRLFQRARHILTHPQSSIEEQIAAIGLLGRDPASTTTDAALLTSLIRSANPLNVQLASLARIGHLPQHSQQPSLGKALVDAWTDTGPKVRTSLLNTLLQRTPWTLELLHAINDGRIVPSEVGASGRQALLTHSNDSIRNRAIVLFNSPDTARPRDSLVNDLLQQMVGQAGNSEVGQGLFEVHCAACHKTGSAGHGAGPNLAMLHNQDLETMLVAIVDPNRAIEEKYRSYTATTRSGNLVTGIILNESGNSITLMDLSGTEQTLLRADLESLTSNTGSLMPEGFETLLGPADFANLIAFIHSSAIPPKVIAGNKPALLLPDQEGTIHLSASHAEIFGDTLIFESQYKNLGYWSSLNDRAGWTLEIEKPTQFDVWLDWACSSRNAGSQFILQIANTQIEGQIQGTGTWDDYRQSKIGNVVLPPGKHRVTLRPGDAFNGFLADVRTIQLIPKK